MIDKKMLKTLLKQRAEYEKGLTETEEHYEHRIGLEIARLYKQGALATMSTYKDHMAYLKKEIAQIDRYIATDGRETQPPSDDTTPAADQFDF